MIITISREFGSGGRGLGKRLSDVLKIRHIHLRTFVVCFLSTNYALMGLSLSQNPIMQVLK